MSSNCLELDIKKFCLIPLREWKPCRGLQCVLRSACSKSTCCAVVLMLDIVLRLHRDEVKKLNREKAQLAERLKEAEGAQLRLDGEVNNLRGSASASTERHDAILADTERKLHKAHELAQSRQDEVNRLQAIAMQQDRSCLLYAWKAD